MSVGPTTPGAPPGPTAPPRKKKSRALLILVPVAALLLLGTCCLCLVFAAIKGQQDRAELGPLGAACDGEPVEGAGRYPGGAPRLWAFARGGRGWEREVLLTPVPYRVDDRAGTNLVLCLEAQVRHEDTPCQFETITEIRTYPRNHFTLPVRLVEASTGRVVARGEVQRGPEACVAGIFAPEDEDAFESEDVHVDDIEAWLDRQVGAPGEPTPVPPG